MKATQQLHEAGQSLWLDHITRAWLLASDRWLRLLDFGARSQRLLWASTGTKDPKASDVLYVKSLAAPHSVDTMPEKTLLALADHGEIGPMLPHDGLGDWPLDHDGDRPGALPGDARRLPRHGRALPHRPVRS